MYMKRFFAVLTMCLIVTLSFGLISFFSVPAFAETESDSGSDSSVTISGTGVISQNYNLADRLRYTGKLPSSSESSTLTTYLQDRSNPLSADYSRLFTFDKSGELSLELSSSEGGALYNFSENNGTYTLLDTIENIQSLTYTGTSMQLTVKNTFVGKITFSCRLKITYEEDGSSATKYSTWGTITFNVRNVGVYYTNGYNGQLKIPYENATNYTYNESFIKNYILALYNNGTTISKDDSSIKYGNPVYDGTTGEVTSYTCENQIDTTLYNEEQRLGIYYTTSGSEDAVSIQDALLIYFEKEIPQEDTLSIYIGETLVSNTSASNRYTLNISAGTKLSGRVVCTSGNTSGTVSLANEVGNFSLNCYVDSDDDGKDGTSSARVVFTLSQHTMKVGTFDLNILATDVISDFSKTIYLRIVVSTTQAPTITLYGNTIIIDKGSSMDGLNDEYKGLVKNIILYDGSTLSGSDLEELSDLTISCNITSTASAGQYTITYSYQDKDTGLTGTATATLVVNDKTPIISMVIARTVEDDKLVQDGGEVVITTPIYFEVTAYDPEEDAISYFASTTKGNIVQDGTKSEKFTFEPSASIAGVVTFTFTVSDGNSSIDYIYTITFKDNVPPTITLNSSVTEEDGKYYLKVSRKTYIYFRNYIESVADNSSTLSNNDVTITPTGFAFSDNQERYSFSSVGNYSVTYSLQDASGNRTSITVYISIINNAPTGQNKSYEYGYGECAELNLLSLASDDTLGYEIALSGFVMDADGASLPTQTFRIDDGIVYLEMSSVYSEEQERNIPFVGNVYFRYRVIDADNLESDLYMITVTFKDLTAPVLTKTDKIITFIRGRDYSDFTTAGYFTAFDEIDGTLQPVSTTIYRGEQVVNAIEFNQNADYKIVYEYVDNAGNRASGYVEISIVSGERPTIELLATEAKISINANFDIFNFIYRIRDEEDGDKTSGFKALRENGSLNIDDGAVDTSKSGEYVIRMYYVDSDGNASETIQFILTVEEPKEFPMEIIYYGAGGVGLIALIIIIRVISVKRKMRI